LYELKIKEIARKEFAYIYFSVKKDFFEGYVSLNKVI